MSETVRVGSPVVQAGHGFARATVVRFDGDNWVKGTAGQTGLRLVGSIIDQDTFEAVQLGELDGLDDLDLIPGAQYYAHASLPGAWSTVPTSSPLFRAYSTSVIHVEPASTSAPTTTDTSGFVTHAQLASTIAAEIARATAADAAVLDDALDADTTGTESIPLLYNAENKAAGTLVRGTAVATHSSGVGIIAAIASGLSRPCVGLLTEDTAPTFAGAVQKDGLFVLADWTPVTGSVTLVRGPYYLDPGTPGMLTSIAPTADGDLVQPVGYAVAPDTLEVEIANSVYL